MAFASTAVSAGTTASVAFTFDNEIQRIVVKNTDGSADVYLGGSDVSSSNGFPLGAGESVAVPGFAGEELYVRTASGTVAVRVLAGGS